jgi:exosortase A
VLLPMGAVAVAWMLADLVVVNAATQFAFVTLLILAVPAVLGLQVTGVILFPLLFLYFGVPFGEFLVPTMIDWTADFTVYALQLTGIPVFREGQNFVIPSGRWSVIDECSGVRYVMASLMVGSLFAYLNYRSYRRRAVFMVVALVLPVLANWFRAYMIVMLAHLSGNKLAVGVDHILYGWVFFGLIIFAMFIVGARWSQPDDVVAGDASRLDGAPPASAASMLTTALAAAAIALLPHLAVAMLERSEGSAAAAQLELPDRLGAGWSTDGAQLVSFTPQFANPSAAAFKAYVGAAGTVGVHLAYFRGQNDDRKLVSSTNMLVGMRDDHWALPTTGNRSLTVDGQTLALRTAEILAHDRGVGRRSHLVVWRLYWIDGRFIAGDAQAKLAGVAARLRGRGDEGALLILYADADTVAASNAALEAFVQANLKELNALLQHTRDTR